MSERAYYVTKRMILMYDFDRAGFRQPQMTQRRRIIVLLFEISGGGLIDVSARITW